MSWFNSYASQTSDGISGFRGRTTRYSMFVLLPLVAALALVPAVASAMLFSSLFGGSNAHAFSATQFDVTPSTTQAGAHPTLNVQISRSGSDSEDIKNVVVDLPPGLLANPEAVTTKCGSFYFSIDMCSANAESGDMSADVIAMGALPMTVSGSIDVLQPNTTDAATLGYTLRPIGSSIGVLSKSYIKNNVTVNTTTDYSLKNTHLSLPTTTKAIVGLIPVPITMQKLNQNFHAKANSSQTGKYFMLNSSLCGTSTSKLSMTSYQNVTVTDTDSFTSTGCGSVPMVSTIATSYTNLNSEKSTGTTVTLTMPTVDATQQSSTLKKALITYPQGSGLDFNVLNGLTGCSIAAFKASSCPAASQIGTASAAIPPLPPSFSGKIYSLDPIGATLHFGVALSGPRGVKAWVYGKAEVQGVGPAQRVVATVDDAPPFPVTNFKLQFTKELLTNPASCGTQTTTADLTGHSGQTTSLSSNFTTVNCAPDTTITSSPASPSSDNTPSFSFTATPATGATFQCAFDSGDFSSCTTGQAHAALSDGSHLFRVRACNTVGNCDHTPAEYDLTVDTVAPTLSISAPANASTVTTSDVSIVFDSEVGATTVCRIDGGAWVACTEPSALFTGLSEASHTADVRATDAAGNQTTQSTTFTVDITTGGTYDTEINDGVAGTLTSPRGDLAITDTTPTFSFDSLPSGAPSFECSVDGAAFVPCASPYTTAELGQAEVHTFAVRADGDATAAEASFFVDYWGPGLDVQYLDNQDNNLTDTQAAKHPDVDVLYMNPAGNPEDVAVSLPDGFWGSLGAADQCSLTDVSSGACGAGSKIGTLELTAATNDNVSHTFTSDVYMTESPGDALAGLAANVHITYDGKDYGYLRDDAIFAFNARYDRLDPNYANVHDPKGVNARAENLPHSTDVHPGVDGSVALHVRELKVHLDGDTGIGIGKPLLTAPSSCDLKTATSTFVDTEASSSDFPLDYQATDCGSVAFDPTLVQSYSPTTAGSNTVVSADVQLPDEHSTIKSLILDLPVSIQPQFAGLVSTCMPADTRLIPPACDDATQNVGTVEIDTPLLATPLYGSVYLEESGQPLPNLYIYASEPGLGLDVRLRGSTQTIGDPAHLRFRINAEQDGALTNISDFPMRAMVMDLPGSVDNLEIVRVSTGCRKIDSTSSGDFTGWSGATKTVTQTIAFDPACPN